MTNGTTTTIWSITRWKKKKKKIAEPLIEMNTGVVYLIEDVGDLDERLFLEIHKSWHTVMGIKEKRKITRLDVSNPSNQIDIGLNRWANKTFK